MMKRRALRLTNKTSRLSAYRKRGRVSAGGGSFTYSNKPLPLLMACIVGDANRRGDNTGRTPVRNENNEKGRTGH